MVILSKHRYVWPLNGSIKLYKSMAKLFQQPYFQLGQGDFTKKGFISNL